MLARRPVAYVLVLALTLVLALVLPAPATIAAGPPALSLPIPPGETWKIIQGYNCGTHAGYDKNAIDLVNANGRTRGAPIRAAADGTYWWWGDKGGTVILSHGGGYYTMYTHLESRVPFSKGAAVKRGEVIGTAGAAGTVYSNPHLHFELFYGEGPAASNRRTLPLSFVEGYQLPNSGTCNEHMGVRLTASGRTAAAANPATQPTPPRLLDPGQGRYQIVRWHPGESPVGVKGYQIYVGPDPEGTGEWFVAEPQVALPDLAPGRTYVRARTIDQADNTSAWVTLLTIDR
ncbi:murein hydrolase activator EnvC family protein [Kallotenue papyrolyticum]|uniref:murein hydrolase activator EnvC family protein n=1 Tax=Kallotenue papyrolyticum TaxID=1325125 RepID=UPI0004711D8B|nr:M23 family metallopeptidase [Kallotenue papyrolyticum]